MVKTEMISTGEKFDFEGLTFPNFKHLEDFSQSCYLYDANTLNIISLNKNALEFHQLESAEMLNGKNSYDLQKMKKEKNPLANLAWADKKIKELELVLSTGKAQECEPHNNVVDEKGYCVVNPLLRIPVYRGKKLVCIFTTFYSLTKYTPTFELYQRYKETYPDQIILRNEKFLDYLGMPLPEGNLTEREIETLIMLSKHYRNKNSAKEMGIELRTFESHIHKIKLKFKTNDLSDILLFFSTYTKRKF